MNTGQIKYLLRTSFAASILLSGMSLSLPSAAAVLWWNTGVWGDYWDSDNDNDGMADSWETAYGLNPSDNNDANGNLDMDGLSNLQEYQLGINPANAFDPVIAAPGANYIIGVDDRNFGTPDYDPALVSGVAWANNGNYLASGTLDRMNDVVFSANYDFCGVGSAGIWCWWWVSDNDVIYNDFMPPVVINSTPVPVAHDQSGFLRYEQSPGVWVPAITDAFKIASDHHERTCVVSKTLGVYCWSANSLADPVVSSIPAALKNVTTVTDITLGKAHACAVKNNNVQCWGDNEYGQATIPGNINTVKQISAGTGHTCVINADDTVSCWGDSRFGKLGDGNADGYVDGVSNALRIAAGDHHTCAITGSFKTGGTSVICWGDNAFGEVSSIPAELTNHTETPVDIRAAGHTTCVSNVPYNASESALMCWPTTLLP